MTVTSSMLNSVVVCFFFFNDTATTEIYTLSLHDALPILRMTCASSRLSPPARLRPRCEADEQTHARSDPRGDDRDVDRQVECTGARGDTGGDRERRSRGGDVGPDPELGAARAAHADHPADAGQERALLEPSH